MNDSLSMNDYMGRFGIAPNPDYGNGHFNRRIRLRNTPGTVLAELEDCSHAFRINLHHDGELVTAIQAQAIRYPMTGCIGAPAHLKALEGQPLGLTAADYTAREQPRSHCTHLYDLALLALAHAMRDESERLIDIIIPDELQQPITARVSINAREVLRWQLKDWQVLSPYAGKPVYRGFAQWAETLLEGDEKEAGYALQKAYMVAQARRFDADDLASTTPADEVDMHGACFNYSPAVVHNSRRIRNTLRDFSQAEEQLLQFK